MFVSPIPANKTLFNINNNGIKLTVNPAELRIVKD